MQANPQNPAFAAMSPLSKIMFLRENCHAATQAMTRGAGLPIPRRTRAEMARNETWRKPASLLMNEFTFLGWLAQAEPGTRLVYHRGFLAADTDGTASMMHPNDRNELRLLADRAFAASNRDLVHLVQQRIDSDSFAYIAIARPKPKQAGAVLSELLLREAA